MKNIIYAFGIYNLTILYFKVYTILYYQKILLFMSVKYKLIKIALLFRIKLRTTENNYYNILSK